MLTHPLESLSSSATMQSYGRDTGGHGFRISLEIRDDRIYEPWQVAPADPRFAPLRRLRAAS
jgi:hypothetical protein